MSILITSHPREGKSMRQLLRAGCQRHSPRSFGRMRPMPFLYLLFSSARSLKEAFPLFVKMSDQRYRGDRTELLYKLIGQNFKTLREHKRVSIRQVAAATLISIYKLRKMEAGTHRVRSSTLLAVCDYFGVLMDCMVRQDLSKDNNLFISNTLYDYGNKYPKAKDL